MNALLGIICLIIGHDPDANDIRFAWADGKDVFCVYPYQQRLHRCRRCSRYVRYMPLQLRLFCRSPQAFAQPGSLEDACW